MTAAERSGAFLTPAEWAMLAAAEHLRDTTGPHAPAISAEATVALYSEINRLRAGVAALREAGNRLAAHLDAFEPHYGDEEAAIEAWVALTAPYVKEGDQ